MTDSCVKFVFLCCFVLSIQSSIFARDIYVNNLTGHNANFGYEPLNLTYRAGPVRTIACALRLAQSGDRIILAHNPGNPYRENVSLFGHRHSGDFEGPFIIEGNGAVLDGSRLISPESWTYVEKSLFRMKPSNFAFFLLFLDGKPLSRVDVSKNSSSLPKLEPFQWCIFDQFVYLALEERKQPLDYNISCTEMMTGITLTQVNHVQINDLAVQGYQIDGISAFNMVDNLILDNVSIRGNGRYGLMAGKFSRIDIGYSRVGDNASAQLLLDDQAEVKSYQSLFFDQMAPKANNLGGNLVENEEENPSEPFENQELWGSVVVSQFQEVVESNASKETENTISDEDQDHFQEEPEESSSESEETETSNNDANNENVDFEAEMPSETEFEGNDPFAF